jgi:LacI family transcriptional regulator
MTDNLVVSTNEPGARPRTRPTMTDIAKRVGVSQSTVSLVLNEMTGAKVSAATRERVFEVAKALGYQLPRRRDGAAPRSTLDTAVAAPARRRDLVIYLADEVSTAHHPTISIDGARAAAWEHDCLLAVHVTGGNRELEDATLAAVLANPAVLGVVYASIFTREVELPARLADSGLPVVLLNCTSGDRSRPGVVPGEVGGAFAATWHLIEQGHQRIGFINGEPWMDAARDRLKGYRQALATADLAFDPSLVREGDWMSGTGYAQAQALLGLARPPTAIFCANDLMALGALEAARAEGLAVPRQLSLVGYDDQEVARYARPALTTVLLPNYEMGEWAVRRLIDEAAGAAPAGPRQLKMDCPLVARDSVATPHATLARRSA